MPPSLVTAKIASFPLLIKIALQTNIAHKTTKNTGIKNGDKNIFLIITVLYKLNNIATRLHNII